MLIHLESQPCQLNGNVHGQCRIPNPKAHSPFSSFDALHKSAHYQVQTVVHICKSLYLVGQRQGEAQA